MEQAANLSGLIARYRVGGEIAGSGAHNGKSVAAARTQPAPKPREAAVERRATTRPWRADASSDEPTGEAARRQAAGGGDQWSDF
jgi:hypothetical protein